MQGATGFDEAIYDWVVARRSPWLTDVWRVITELGGGAVIVPIMVVTVALLVVARRPWSAAFVALAAGGGLVLQALLKPLLQRPRPPVAGWLTDAGGWSMPSGHALQSASLYLALAVVVVAVARPWRVVVWTTAVVVVVLVGCSRVYLGVHWATDVLLGWLIGAVWVGALATAMRSRFAAEPARVAG